MAGNDQVSLETLNDTQKATNGRLATLEEITGALGKSVGALSKSVLAQNERHDAMAADIAEIKRRLDYAHIPAE